MALATWEYIKMLNNTNAIEGIFLFQEDGIPLVSIKKNELLVDIERIGGLIAAVKDFASTTDEDTSQSINMKTKRIFFKIIQDYIAAIIFPKNELDTEIQAVLDAIINLLKEEYSNNENTLGSNYVLAKFIYNVFNQDLSSEFDLEFGEQLQQTDIQQIIEYIEDFKLEEASKKQPIPSEQPQNKEPKEQVTSTPTTMTPIDNGETLSANQFHTPLEEPINTQKSAITALFSRFKSMFNEIESVTLVLPSPYTGLDFICISDFPEHVNEKLREIILSMWNSILPILSKEAKERTLHVDDKYIFLYPVDFHDSSFIYVVLSSNKSLSMIDLILERIVKTLRNMLPSDDTIFEV